MKIISLRNMCIIVVCAFSVCFTLSGISQTEASYLDVASELENYYEQHPEFTDPPTHDYKSYLRWRELWDSRVQCMDTNYNGKPRLINTILHQYVDNIDYHNRSTIVASNWKLAGPRDLTDQTNGLVMSIYVDTVNDKTDQTIYIGSNTAGLWKTIDGGASWKNITDQADFPCLGIMDIEGDPANSNIIYAATCGTYMERVYTYGLGIIRSEDAGESWEVIYTLDENNFFPIYRIVVDPSNTNRLYAAVGNKLVRLVKNGATWDTTTIFTTPRDINFDTYEYRRIRDIVQNPVILTT